MTVLKKEKILSNETRDRVIVKGHDYWKQIAAKNKTFIDKTELSKSFP